MLAGVVWVAALASVFAPSNEGGARTVVVTADAAWARSSDSARAPRALPERMPSGTEATLLERRDEWSRVRLANGRDVWMRGSALTAVVDSSATRFD